MKNPNKSASLKLEAIQPEQTNRYVKFIFSLQRGTGKYQGLILSTAKHKMERFAKTTRSRSTSSEDTPSSMFDNV